MSAATRGRGLGVFSTAVLDQVLLSGANFLVGLLLLRYMKSEDYGIYVLVQSALLLIVSAQNAWIAGPLTVMLPKSTAQRKSEMVGAIGDSQMRLLRPAVLVALLAPAIAYLAGLQSGLLCLTIGIAIVVGGVSLRREYLRSVLLISRRSPSVLGADAIYVGVLLAGVAWAAFSPNPAIIWVIGTLVLASAAGAMAAGRAVVRDPGWISGDARPVWREMRELGLWSMAGAVIYWLFGQSYNYVLASRLDLHAVTDVNAARLLLMPCFVLTIGMQSVLSPSAAGWLGEIGLRRLVSRLLLILAFLCVMDGIYFGVVWFARDWLIGDVLHKQIGNRDELLVLWAGVALIGLLRDVLGCGLYALGRFKSLAGQTAISAAVALSIMWVGVGWWGSSAVLIGQIVGELVNIAGIIILLRLQIRKHPGKT